MPFREPSWWYVPAPSLAARLLSPAAYVYGTISARRMDRAPDYQCPLPVVCIGNFTAGGTGKTPLSLLLARRLAARGIAPVFLTRGYGSSVRAPTFIDPSRDDAAAAGDEALLLARAAPVMVSPDRAAGARAIVEGGTKADVILMDDGLQNPSLFKDLQIAVVDGARGFGNGRVIPAGPLRAALDVQLERTDVVIVNGRREDRDAIARILEATFNGPVLSARTQPSGDTGWLQGLRVLAFAGIGNPERFFRLLEERGAVVAERRTFPDHHVFTEAEAAQLLSDAQRLDAALVTTEKDLVRLSGATGARLALARQARALAIVLALEEADATRLTDTIADLIKQRG